MSKKKIPRILVITSRYLDTTDNRVLDAAGPILRKKLENCHMVTALCIDTDPADAIILLQQRKFDAILYYCPGVYRPGYGNMVEWRTWEILEAKTKTLNADTPTVAITLYCGKEEIDRMHALGVGHIFETNPEAPSLKNIMEKIGENVSASAK